MSRSLFLAAVLAAIAALAADWRQFRGPGGCGISTDAGVPTTWSATDNILWRTKLPGPGTSSPITVGKRIYLTCYSGYGLKDGEGELNNLLRQVRSIGRA